MFPVPQQVVSPKQFDRLFRDEAIIATFASDEDEADYERRDSFLIHLIRRVVERHFGPASEHTPHVVDDWWPNHTRYLDLSRDHCTPGFLADLHALLSDEYHDWRIQVCVYEDHVEGESYIGSSAIYQNRVLIERKLHALIGSSSE